VNRSREQKELSSKRIVLFYILVFVFAHYLGDLKPQIRNSDYECDDDFEEDYNGVDDSPLKEYSKALKYPSHEAFCDALRKADAEVFNRESDAFCRLFAKVGLDFATAPSAVLFESFVTMLNQVPEQWLNLLRSILGEHCEIAAGSNHPRWLTGDILCAWRR
jgi:hypothetical protein